MIDKLTQQQKLLRHMIEIGPITKPEAHNLYYIENVGQRIAELREQGYAIPNPARMIKTAGGARIAVYELVGEQMVWGQYSTMCACGKSWYTINGRCNKCGVERGL